ncbi:MAG: dihydroorotate dehydrogenase-like protein [Anaerolineales bacterium]|nr:MAG: dihydroorotate dehydrogenase-like protein [Anaerolineales bacterium]
MSSLKTTYMGIELDAPIVVAASSISSLIDRIKLAEQAGAGLLVIRSLFEEQIQMEALRLEDQLSVGADSFPEALNYFPEIEHGGAQEHLMWIEKTRKEVDLPLIASLNAVSPGSWIEYAKQLEATGIDGLELNVYAVATNPKQSGADIEKTLYETVEAVAAEVKIPVAVKLSPFYTSVANVVYELDKRGAAAVVLFNRFLQPDIDLMTESLKQEMVYSTSEELKLPLRWVALLYGRVKADLALNTGVHSGLDAAKAFLAGAQIVQVASALLKNGIPYLSTMLRELESWMETQGYDQLEDFRGKLSQKKVDDPFAFERAQYVKLLMSQK